MILDLLLVHSCLIPIGIIFGEHGEHHLFFVLHSIADCIIEHQQDIKKQTKALSDQNTELQTKSGELQEVLRSSQAQLLSQTSIPLELINSLAATVSEMKNCHQVVCH